MMATEGWEVGRFWMYFKDRADRIYWWIRCRAWASLVAQRVKNLPSNAGDLGLILGVGRSLGEGNGYPLQYSCLENSMDRGAWLGYSSWDCKESDTTEQLSLFSFSITIIRHLLYAKHSTWHFSDIRIETLSPRHLRCIIETEHAHK